MRTLTPIIRLRSLSILLLLGACSWVHHGSFEKASLVLSAPRDGQVVGGDAVLLLATSEIFDATELEPVFEFSPDGRSFEVLDGDPGPDYGPASHAALLDATLFPSGPLTLRARSGDLVSKAIRVVVSQPPFAACSARAEGLMVAVDCSASKDPDGEVQSFLADFGEGERVVSADGRFIHTYSAPGAYDLTVSVFDEVGIYVNWILNVVVEAGGTMLLAAPRGCGCDHLYLFAGGTGALRDPRRSAPNGGFPHPALGPDPAGASTNFEIEAVLLPGSDPDLCEEGQSVKRTSRVGRGQPEHKRACTAGRALPSCTDDASCDTHTCRGGTLDGESCDGLTPSPAGVPRPASRRCKLAGGVCRSNRDGRCTSFPFAGGARGNDDYREHAYGDEGAKVVCPGCRSPRWFDAPGTEKAPPADIHIEADFLAFVHGIRDCQCHFRLVVDWVADADAATPGNQPGHRPGGASGIDLLTDAETVNCTLFR